MSLTRKPTMTWKFATGSFKELYNFVSFDVGKFVNIFHETKRFVLYQTFLNYYLFQ
jgi:hypothetical protein